MNDFLLGICLSIYPGLRNTCADLPKVVCSSCFKILRIHFKITRKTQEIAFQGFPISKFSRGSMPPNPPRYLAPSARDCPPQLQCLGAATALRRNKTIFLLFLTILLRTAYNFLVSRKFKMLRIVQNINKMCVTQILLQSKLSVI